MRCTRSGCGSYAFNLARDGVDQESLCDVHYWQDKAEKLKAANAELVEALDSVKGFAEEAYAHWNEDRDMKVGKHLLAISGSLKGYDRRMDALQAALAKHKETTC